MVAIPNGWGGVVGAGARECTTGPRLTLTDAWQQWRLPALRQDGRRPATIDSYRSAISAWESFWKSKKSTPSKHGVFVEKLSYRRYDSQPEISQIDRHVLTDFREWLLADGSRSKSTVNRIIKSVRSILLAAVEADAIPAAPTLKRLAAARNARKLYFPIEHVDALYEACSAARWPTLDARRHPLVHAPAAYWRAAVVLYFTYGFRVQELIAYEAGHQPLRFSNVSFAAESPASDLENQHGWLWYVPLKQSHVKPEPLVLPLTELARLHLKSIWRDETLDAVFPFPRNERRFRDTWAGILRAARITPKRALSGGEYRLSDFRKTSATWHNLHCRGIAPFVLGHASRDDRAVAMVDTHYDNPEQALVRHFQSLPHPQSFSKIKNQNQRLLFSH